jgi:hypothetical protein
MTTPKELQKALLAFLGVGKLVYFHFLQEQAFIEV